MPKFLFVLIGLLALTCLLGSARASPTNPIRVSIIRTGTVMIPENFAFSGGRLSKKITLNHSAILVDHPRGRIMFDTGLGEKIDAQFASDMPWWGHALFSYKKGISARRQLDQAQERWPNLILLSHGHWDHASALADFRGVPVVMDKEEVSFLKVPHRGSVFGSQFDGVRGRIRSISLESAAVGSYPKSLDVFGDGRVLLIGMAGHTPGSIGLLVQTSSGRKYFFVGDVVWSAAAIASGSPKFWLPRAVVDHDPKTADRAVIQLRKFMATNPEVSIIPAHDGHAQDKLGYFPNWIN